MSIKSFILFALLLALSMATPDSEWESFKTQFNRKYKNPVEEAFRKKIFLDSKMTIDQHNKKFEEGKVTFTMGINQFSDMTTEEYNEQMNGYVMAPEDPSAPVHQNTGDPSPNGVDWREKKCVTRVKNQKACGSCWAFAATGAVESIHCINTGELVEVSEQQLMDCSWDQGNRGCQGGNVNKAFQYVISKNGLVKEADYQYEGRDNTCQYEMEKKAAAISSFNTILKGKENDLMNAVTVQPVAVAVDANHTSFKDYKTGIYFEKDCSQSKLTHAMLVVGFGTESGLDYWIVKNSWGADNWGEDGYIRMSRNRHNNCGIATQASYPVF